MIQFDFYDDFELTFICLEMHNIRTRKQRINKGEILVEKSSHLNTHTKTRVLAYLREICLILKDKGLPLNTLERKLEDFSQENLHFLNDYHRKIGKIRGIITPETKSAERYIKLAEDMGLLARKERIFSLTKYGRVLEILSKKQGKNPFELDWKEASFFLKHLLEFDTIYFFPCIFNLSKYRNLSDLSFSFKKDIISYLKNWFKTTSNEYLRERIVTIEKWTNEKRYVENLVPPRLYWCFDLRIVDLTGNGRVTYDLTQVYKTLINKLPILESPMHIKEWGDANFYSTFFESYKNVHDQLAKKIRPFKDLSFSQEKSIIIPRLEKAFEKGQKFPIPSKVLFSQFSEVTCTELLEEGIVCEINEIKNFIHSLSQRGEKYYLYWDPEVNDGFIRKL